MGCGSSKDDPNNVNNDTLSAAMKRKRVPLEPAKQRTVDSDTITKMALPADVELEKARQSVIKSDQATVCFLCKGTGTTGGAGPMCVPVPAPGEKKSEPISADAETLEEPALPSRLPSVQGESKVVKYVTESKGSDPVGKELKEGTCWVCEGKGKLTKSFARFEAPADDDAGHACQICWDAGRYGLSLECDHFYCAECIASTLKSALDRGKFPAYCPACEVAAGPGKIPPCGLITAKALAFLEQRGVIDENTQFRFMLQSKELKRSFFTCPAGCGRTLLDVKDIRWDNATSGVYALPGACPCGALVCVICKKQMRNSREAKTTHQACAQRDFTKATELDEKMLWRMQERGIKKCPKCGALMQKNEGCHIMKCGTHAHGSTEVAKRMGGCGYESDWGDFLPLVGRLTINPPERRRKYSSATILQSQINSRTGWRAAKQDKKQWAQLDLGKKTTVIGIQIQAYKGWPDPKTWVTMFRVSSSCDAKTWTLVENGKEFNGPKDTYSLYDRMFKAPVSARYVRILPTRWQKAIAGRFAAIIPGKKKMLSEKERKQEKRK